MRSTAGRLVLWSLWASSLVQQRTAPVKTDSGLVRGVIAPDGSHASYLGIPYATVEKRFQAARPYPPWHGTLDANNGLVRCTQRGFFGNGIIGQEDCLVLNVYTPLPSTDDRLKPVMVYIHGGGFKEGSGAPLLYGPDYLVQHDIILVTFNYRVEILGFLCLGIEEAPGNAGLKDQVEALKWVKRNIKAFSGDPDNITLFGESSGSVSVTYHILSPMSKGLFQKAILQSGSALAPWGFQFEPVKTASLLAKVMGHNTEDLKEIYNFFINKTAEELLSTRIPRKKGDIVQSEHIFVPCLEKPLPGTDRFITDIPYNLISTGEYSKMPMIIGFNSEEGFMLVGKENKTTIADFNFYDALPRNLAFPTKSEALDTASKLKQLYKGDERDKLLYLARFEGDLGLTYPVIRNTELFLETNDNPIYAYNFSYSGLLNLAKLQAGFAGYTGASHADELFYLFRPQICIGLSLFETKMIDVMTTMWTNFAKFGNPTPKPKNTILSRWPPLEKLNPRLLVIDKQISTAPLWENKAMRFWNETYTKYRRIG